MKHLIIILSAVVAIVITCSLMHYSAKDSIIEDNVEALSEGEGHFLYDCEVYSSFGGHSSTAFVCNKDTTNDHLFPCLSFGLSSSDKKQCYK